MTEEMTFAKDDKLGGRAEYAERLTQAISKFHTLADGAYVLSLNAPFGAGKTHFLSMWKSYLQKEHYQVISINAWETDFAENPAIPIISALVEGIAPKNQKAATKLKDALHTAMAASAMIGNQLLSHKTGIDVKEVVEGVESEKEGKTLAKAGERLYHRFAYQQKAFKELRSTLSEFVQSLPEQGKKSPLIILVDELDRARPDYAVNFLETIKHLFAVSGIVFVLAVNRQQLEISVRQLFGTDIDFKDYYLRFVTTETNLPEPNQDDLKEYIKSRLQHYFPSHNFAQSQGSLIDYITNLAIIFDLKLRSIDAYIRRIRQTDLALDKTSTESLHIISLYTAIGFSNESFYKQISQKDITPQDTRSFYNSLPFARLGDNESDARRELSIDLFCGCAPRESIDMFGTALSKLLSDHSTPQDASRHIAKCRRYFGITRGSIFNYLSETSTQWRAIIQ